jgi:hypothetical protein
MQTLKQSPKAHYCAKCYVVIERQTPTQGTGQLTFILCHRMEGCRNVYIHHGSISHLRGLVQKRCVRALPRAHVRADILHVGRTWRRKRKKTLHVL